MKEADRLAVCCCADTLSMDQISGLNKNTSSWCAQGCGEDDQRETAAAKEVPSIDLKPTPVMSVNSKDLCSFCPVGGGSLVVEMRRVGPNVSFVGQFYTRSDLISLTRHNPEQIKSTDKVLRWVRE